MKKLLLILICLPIIGFGQDVNIPDANFKNYLVNNNAINTNGDTEIQVSEASAYTGTINVSNKSISDLTGIEAFIALTTLECFNNQLTSLDVSNNTALTHLYCGINPLTTLDVSQNTALIVLRCGTNQLTSLDVSNNTALIELRCEANQITSLDVSNNTALTYLKCSENQLTSLNVSNKTALIEFTFDLNQLTSLDVSNNTALTTLSCYNNQLTALDLSQNTALTHFNCRFNQLTTLDVRNGNNMLQMGLFLATNNPNLSCISVEDPVWSAANWTNIDPATSFGITCSPEPGYTYVPDDNFEQALINLGYDNFLDDYVYTNSINSVNSLMVNSANISDLTGIEGFTTLTILDCDNNQLTNLDVSNNTSLTFLRCSFNQLTSLDVTNHTLLSYLLCQNNQLTSLDFNLDINLWTGPNHMRLNCANNNLATLNLSGVYLTAITNELVFTNNPNLSCIIYGIQNYNAVIIFSIQIDPWTSLSETESITHFVVACDSYTWNGTVHANSGVYTHNNSVLGCDSILSLTINNSTSSTDSHVACDSFIWNCDGNTYTESNNTATYTYTNAAGCDSVVTLDLTINNSSSSTDAHVACDEFIWSCDGNIYTESNSTATYTYTNAAGCDSVVTLDLTINNSSSNTTTETTCDSYVWLVDGNTYTTSGTYTDISVNSDGCDHTETLELTVSSTLATISQSGDSLFAVTTPIGLNADWYNIQTEDSTKSIWLMQENTSLFSPRFDCSYFIVVSNNGCTDTSAVYYYGENAARIGSIITSPNPTSGLINVKFDNPKNQFVMLQLINNSGSKLDEFVTVENNLNIDLSKYPSGSYYLYFNSEAEAQGCRLEKPQKTSTKIILNK